jgi:hypothetical protein
MRLRLFDKRKYRTKTKNVPIHKIIKKIEELKNILDTELNQEYGTHDVLSFNSKFYYGRDVEVEKIMVLEEKKLVCDIDG